MSGYPSGSCHPGQGPCQSAHHVNTAGHDLQHGMMGKSQNIQIKHSSLHTCNGKSIFDVTEKQLIN